tara:strand:- start:145 stop:534 length:390 start_codon:yes stop_codon:yes gene_type:complete
MKHFCPQPKEEKKIPDNKYLNFVKQLPCCICDAWGEPYGQAPSDAHHPIHGRYSGSKGPDHTALPFCKAHHQTGEYGKLAIHRGKETFEKKYGKDTDFIEVTQDKVKAQFGYAPKQLQPLPTPPQESKA